MYYVYFIKQSTKKGHAPIKIGYSKNPHSRLKDLQTASPTKLKLCASLPFKTIKEAVLMERCLHFVCGKRFKRVDFWSPIISMPV